jgi:hypothetical protein
MDTPNGITAVKELRNTYTTRCSQTSESTNEIREEGDQNSTDTTDGITTVRYFRDILPFHDLFLQQLGDRHRWVLYRVSFSDSPDQQFDAACDRTWTKEVGPLEITCLNKIVYRILQEVFQDFAPAHPIFWRHQVKHPLSASRVWFSLRDRFKVHGSDKKQPTKRVLQQQHTEKTKTGNRTSHPPNTSTRILYNRHTTQNNTPHTPHKDTPRHTHVSRHTYIHETRHTDTVSLTHTYLLQTQIHHTPSQLQTIGTTGSLEVNSPLKSDWNDLQTAPQTDNLTHTHSHTHNPRRPNDGPHYMG